MFACRNCRSPIGDLKGCAICEDFKQKHLVAVDEDIEAKPSLSEVGTDIVADLQYARRLASKAMRDVTLTTAQRLDATARILKIGNTAAKVLEAARKLQTDGLEAVKNMSFLERAKLYVEWYLGLPPAYKGQLRDQMDKLEARAALPAAEGSTP